MTETTEDIVKSDMTRRKLLAAGGIAAVGLTAAACSSGSTSTPTATSSDPLVTTPPTGGGSGGGSVVTSVAKVPVGGAEITSADDKSYVVSQQTAGNVACYSAVCPHQGCLVNQIQGNEAVCPCHGSRFNVFSGDVEQGPAQTGLTKVNVKVSGGNVVLG